MAAFPQIFDMSDPEGAERGIAAAVSALETGELVGLPTETVYGLAADATDGAAVAAIFQAKGRPRFNPLIIHTPSFSTAGDFAMFNREASGLAESFWPGPMTLVLPRRRSSPVSELATVGLDTIAVRVPAHPVARAVLEGFGRAVAAPSANRSGHVSPTIATHVTDDLGERVAVVLDAGPTGIGIESTIVGCWGESAVLLRAGGIPREEIERQLGRPLATPEGGEQTPSAPGRLASHYAPAANLRLSITKVRPGEALLAFGPALPTGTDHASAIVNLSPRGDLSEAAARLFSALRELDAKADTIAVAEIPETGLGEAINDRLRRAAAPREET